MIAELTQWIMETIRAHGAWSVFLGVLIEQIIVPIPSPAIIMGAGFILVPSSEPLLSAFGQLTLKVVLPGTLASTLGAWGGYYAGRFGGRLFVERFERYLGFGWDDVERMGKRVGERGVAASMFFLRALPIVPLSLVSIVSGVLTAPLSTYLLWSFLGAIPRCYILGWLGWQLGASATAWAGGVNRFESVISLVIIAAVVGAIIYLRRRERR
jgi:membrane protein DedA with SNARE-associated domain